MSQSKITPASVVQHDGVLAAGVYPTETWRSEVFAMDLVSVVGSERIKLNAMVSLMRDIVEKSGEAKVRILVGSTTVTAVKFLTCVVVIAHTTNHPIVKSAQRMMKKLGRSTPLAETPSPQAQPHV